MANISPQGTILVTGGAGYIGSHACVALVEAGYKVLVLDNLCNSNPRVLDRIHQITGVRPEFVNGDIRDRGCLDQLMSDFAPVSVMHFAGLKSVGESVEKPDEYQGNNVGGTRVLLDAMANAGIHTLVFSSSATVYGEPDSVPITEDFPLRTTNPYGQTKLDIENLLAAKRKAEPQWRFARLRYFNPVGAHASGLIGEDPSGIPNNLMPFIAQVAVGRREFLEIFGDDYPTTDGTGVRDYIHVTDLVRGHLDALAYLSSNEEMLTVNLGTGKGVSVLEMVQAFEEASGLEVSYRIAPRRAGDIAECYADPGRAKSLLNWSAQLGLDEMCGDAWRWQRSNPEGYSR